MEKLQVSVTRYFTHIECWDKNQELKLANGAGSGLLSGMPVSSRYHGQWQHWEAHWRAGFSGSCERSRWGQLTAAEESMTTARARCSWWLTCSCCWARLSRYSSRARPLLVQAESFKQHRDTIITYQGSLHSHPRSSEPALRGPLWRGQG